MSGAAHGTRGPCGAARRHGEAAGDAHASRGGSRASPRCRGPHARVRLRAR
ncbi:hypothetical protein M218_09105 [Burkholderia pseudomallei MSHR338]|nr:hypothetical protein M218_09105 [Burkholderia pseudomallei MSHR338]